MRSGFPSADYISSFLDKSSDSFREIEGVGSCSLENGREGGFPRMSTSLSVMVYLGNQLSLSILFIEYGGKP